MVSAALRWIVGIAAAAALVPGCGGTPHESEADAAVSLLFVGDVMMGRGVAPIVAGDPDGLFRDVRHIISGADVAMANLESPLTTLPHSSNNPNALVADPSNAPLLASAGFDVVSLANNHAGDAGAASITETIDAVLDAGIIPTGAGSNAADAAAPAMLERGGVTIAVLAFDVSGGGLEAGTSPGVAVWDRTRTEAAVRHAKRVAEVVVVSLHGGVEYLWEPDPRMVEITDLTVAWGADIVWGHGPHVAYPVRTVDSGDRTGVIAASLGNFLFDQRGVATGVGSILEVLVGPDGVGAFRTGSTSHHDLRVHFTGWNLPEGDAGYLGGAWWELVGSTIALQSTIDIVGFPWGDVAAAAKGRVTSSDRDEVVVSFRKLSEPHVIRDGQPDVQWIDAQGRTVHLGIYTEDLAALWVASMVPGPIAEVAACDGSVAMAYSGLDSDDIIGTGAAVWRPRELVASDRLPGVGSPSCLDINGDGRTEPVIVNR